MAAQRELSTAGRRILAAAARLFYEQGITAVGVDRIAEESGVTKRTLYDQFGSKDRVIEAYLAERDERWRALVDEAIAAAPGPREALLAPFAALEEWTGGGTRGCAFLNALAELPDPEHPGHRIAAEQKAWLRRRFAANAVAAGCADPEALATRLLLLHEGALAMQPLETAAVGEALAAARVLVDAREKEDA